MPFTRLRYHLVFATKGRAPWITPKVERVLYAVLGKAAKDIGARTLLTNGVEDHIHSICAVPPKLSISDFVRHIKAVSSAAVSKSVGGMARFKWQVGYGGFTLNPLDMDRIFDYVRNQKEHHRTRRTWDVYEAITHNELKGEDVARTKRHDLRRQRTTCRARPHVSSQRSATWGYPCNANYALRHSLRSHLIDSLEPVVR